MSSKPATGKDSQQIARDTILAAEASLQRASFPDVRRVFCTFSEGTLTLAGTVSSQFFSNLAFLTVHGLDHVVAIENNLVVVSRHRTRHLVAPALRGRPAFSAN